MPGLSARASSTERTTWERKLPSPTVVTSTRSDPVVLTEPPITLAPGSTSIGIGSPVTRDWSIAERPSATTPSTETRLPGRTRITSPTRISETATSISEPSRSTRAMSGRRSSRRLTAWELRVLTSSDSHSEKTW